MTVDLEVVITFHTHRTVGRFFLSCNLLFLSLADYPVKLRILLSVTSFPVSSLSVFITVVNRLHLCLGEGYLFLKLSASLSAKWSLATGDLSTYLLVVSTSAVNIKRGGYPSLSFSHLLIMFTIVCGRLIS